jgi:hypothetical protein
LLGDVHSGHDDNNIIKLPLSFFSLYPSLDGLQGLREKSPHSLVPLPPALSVSLPAMERCHRGDPEDECQGHQQEIPCSPSTSVAGSKSFTRKNISSMKSGGSFSLPLLRREERDDEDQGIGLNRMCQDHMQQELGGRSLFIFSGKNPIRVFFYQVRATGMHENMIV